MTLSRELENQALPIIDAEPGGPLSTVERIRRIVETVLGVVVPDVGSNIIGLGANSMELVRIINLIEDEMGLRLKFEDVSFEPSIAELAKSVEATRECEAHEPAQYAASQAVTETAHLDLPAVTGIRHDAGWPVVMLAEGLSPVETVGASVRAFGHEPLALAGIAQLLDALKLPERGASAHAGYASAGALYPVQTYLYAKAGRVDGLPCGLYYYHPLRRELWLLSPDLVFDESLYEPLFNAPFYRDAAFAIYLVSRPAAIKPSYGDRARDYCLLEAGAMAQLLRMRAPSCGIGLCAIGDFAFEPVRNWFELDDDQACLHSLVGGSIS
ncbi:MULTISPECIES: SagB family peptide dehydrogenase [unclassified Pseudomonas]|uniref:SagB family peptide dehydrogenase n=1 Tax=unclassified Pseudomonas TaxID=196821 RepID=UPI000CD1635C|nr:MULTISPECIES: SagB family peptide dehydrogenase [unclassified Pseudomonas]POA11566.1 peptide synthetase [Pseudomonas sp. MPBD7-1]